YQPGTKEGDRLIAHELTHVVQGQRSGIQRKADAAHASDGAHDAAGAGGAAVSHPSEPAGKEADAVAHHVADAVHGKGEQDAGGEDTDGQERKTQHAAPPIAAKLHYLFTGSADEGDGPLADAILGGVEVGDDRGYGPARFLDPDEVCAVAT